MDGRAEERYPLGAFTDLDGGTVVGRPQYNGEYHRYGEVAWEPDEEGPDAADG